MGLCGEAVPTLRQRQRLSYGQQTPMIGDLGSPRPEVAFFDAACLLWPLGTFRDWLVVVLVAQAAASAARIMPEGTLSSS